MRGWWYPIAQNSRRGDLESHGSPAPILYFIIPPLSTSHIWVIRPLEVFSSVTHASKHCISRNGQVVILL